MQATQTRTSASKISAFDTVDYYFLLTSKTLNNNLHKFVKFHRAAVYIYLGKRPFVYRRLAATTSGAQVRQAKQTFKYTVSWHWRENTNECRTHAVCERDGLTEIHSTKRETAGLSLKSPGITVHDRRHNLWIPDGTEWMRLCF